METWSGLGSCSCASALLPCFSLVSATFAKETKNSVLQNRALCISFTKVGRVLENINPKTLPTSLVVLWEMKKGFQLMNLQMSGPRSSNLTIFSNPVARLKLPSVEPGPSPKGHFVLTFMLNYPSVVWVWLCVVCVVCVWVGCGQRVWGVCGVCGCCMGGCSVGRVCVGGVCVGGCVGVWVVGGGFPRGSDGKASAYNAGDPGSIPGVGKIPWKRTWQPTPVLLPGTSHGRRSVVGYSLWGHKESDMTE